MPTKFRNKKTDTNRRIIRTDEQKRKTQRAFFKGGEFRFPENRALIRQFFRDFYNSVFTTSSSVTQNKLAKAILENPTPHITANIARLCDTLQIDHEAATMNLAFMIYTYNNKSYYKFVKRYFRADFQQPTKKIMQFILRGGSKGGAKTTAIVPRGTVEISYRMLCISSLLYFLYFSTLLYYTQNIFTENLEKNVAVKFLQNGREFLSRCNVSTARYKPKTKIETMIQNLFRPILQSPTNIENFENFMYLIRDCLSDPAEDFKNTLVFEAFAEPEITKLAEIYGQRLLGSPVPPPTPSTAVSAKPEIILSSTRESIIVTPSAEPLPQRTWISSALREDKSRAMVAIEEPELAIGSVSKVIPTLLKKNPDHFKQLATTMRAYIKDIRDPDKLIRYFDRMSNIDEETFQRLLGKEDISLFSFQGISEILTEMSDYKEYLSYFTTGDIINKFMLYKSGASLSSILYIDFKKQMRAMTSYLKKKTIDTEDAFHNIIDDSMLLIQYMRANWNNIYNMLGSFLTFLVCSIQIFRQYMAARRMRAQLAIEDAH